MINEYNIAQSPLLELSPASNVILLETTPTKAFSYEGNILTMLSPGDDDDIEDPDGDWSDIDDEDFEDLAEDRDDLHQIESDNNIFDAEDDDHLPDDDDD
jgi:hypothetical protein